MRAARASFPRYRAATQACAWRNRDGWRVFGVLFLQITGIRQKDGAEIGRRMGAENGSAKAALDQQRQIAGVVQMGVRENDGVDAARFDRKLRPILEPQRLETLKQAAVDEQLMLLVLDEVFRAGDRPGAAEEGEVQTQAGTFRNSGGVSRLPGIGTRLFGPHQYQAMRPGLIASIGFSRRLQCGVLNIHICSGRHRNRIDAGRHRTWQRQADEAFTSPTSVRIPTTAIPIISSARAGPLPRITEIGEQTAADGAEAGHVRTIEFNSISKRRMRKSCIPSGRTSRGCTLGPHDLDHRTVPGLPETPQGKPRDRCRRRS